MKNWFSEAIVGWYRQNKRDLPWRNTRDAYKIWLSEIILQQTQVAQGLGYYHRFIEKYPNVGQLARANEDEVLKLWQGLGYYSRARNLLASAKVIANEYEGVFPNNYTQIKALKGIGDYTAAAIASFAFNQPHAVVDGNVYRLLSRVYGIYTPIDSGPAKKQFSELAHELLNSEKPAIHNQAIMEFGSQFCKPSNPDCENCVLNSHCFAFKNKAVVDLPVKAKKTKVRQRFFNYLLVTNGRGEFFIHRRQHNDIWKGLHEFLLLETNRETSYADLLKSTAFKALGIKQPELIYSSKVYKHVLSHQLILARFCVIKVKVLPDNTAFIKTNYKKLTRFAMSRLTEKFVNDCDLKEIL